MPHKQFLVNGTLEEAIDALSKRSVDIRTLGAPRLSRTHFDKTAIFGDLGKSVAEKWKSLDPAAQYALAGAGTGGLLGGVASFYDDDEDRSTFGSVLRGGLAGAALGGGVGLANKYWGKGMSETPQASPSSLSPGETWMPGFNNKGEWTRKGGGKVRLDHEKITAEAARRGIAPEQLSKEISDKLERLKPADLDVGGGIMSYVADTVTSPLDHPVAATGAAGVAGLDAMYEHRRRQALLRQFPEVATPGHTGQFRDSLREVLEDTDRRWAAPTELRDIEQTTASGTISTQPRNVVTGPEALEETFKSWGATEPDDWRRVMANDDLSRLAANATNRAGVEAFQAAANNAGLHSIGRADPGVVQDMIQSMADSTNKRLLATHMKHEANILPDLRPSTIRRPMTTGAGGAEWYDPRGWRGQNPVTGRWGTHAVREPSRLRTGGRYLRKGLLPFIAYTLLSKNRQKSDRIMDAMRHIKPYLKQVGQE